MHHATATLTIAPSSRNKPILKMRRFTTSSYRALNPRAVLAESTGMRALSIRQPYAEMILRGEKTIEYRSRPTRLIGQRFYIYAARKWAGVNGHASEDIQPGDAPTGVIVGTATITKCERNHAGYEWHLSDVKRLPKPRKPKGRPQPVWFKPF